MHDTYPSDSSQADPIVSRRRYLAAACAAGAAGSIGATTVAGAQDAAETEPDDVREYLDGRSWRLVWRDEFEDGIDEETWSFAVGNGHDDGIPGWGNEEEQYYTDGENARIEDGSLVVEAREEQAADEHGEYDYTSSRMLTAGKKQFEGGRIDVRAKLPQGQGLWPAIWLLGSDIDEVGWPDCGEIDVMELVGDEPDTVHGTVHGPGYSGDAAIGGEIQLEEGTFSESFHTFSIVWDDDSIQWYVDGDQYFELTREDVEARGEDWVFDGPCYLLLNVAVGGLWPGYPDATTTFPQQMEVEYVREFEEAVVEESCFVYDHAEGSATVDGQLVCDLDGDGNYRDVNADGSVSNGDVTDFFGNQHAPAWDERTDLFDFDGDGDVGQGDVVDLFRYVNQ